MTYSDDITSTTDYRSRQSEVHERLRQTKRPMFITNRGKPEAVLLSPEAYDELLDQAQLPEILASIRQSERELAEGKGKDALDGLQSIAERLGISLDR
jgi:prevent-host-death family protein